MHHMFKRKSLIIFSAFAFCVFIFSLILAFVIIPPIIDSQIDKNVQLERGTDQWDRFRELPFNIFMNVTLFQVKNAENVVNKGETPDLEEKGPYVFNIDQKRINLGYDEKTDLVQYERDQEITFNKSMSGEELDIDDTITMINPAWIAIMQMAPSLTPAFKNKVYKQLQKCLEEEFGSNNFILENYPIKKLIYEGIKVCDFNADSCKVNVLIKINLCDNFKGISKNLVEVKNGNDHYMSFSLLGYKFSSPNNLNLDGIYKIKSGINNISELGDTRLWNDQSYTKIWKKDVETKCDEVKGSDATIFPPHLTPDTVIHVYATDICRHVELFYTGEGTYEGIDGYFYRTSKDLFRSTEEDPDEDCFCSQSTADEDGKKSCFLDGVLDASPCIGAPVLASYPHFLYADEKYGKGLNLSPDPDKHGIYALLDKYTGIPLRAHERLQLNIVLRPMEEFSETKTFPRLVLPIAWVDLGVDLPPYGINLLNSLLYNTLELVNILKYVFIAVSLIATIVAIILLCCHICTDREK